MSYFRSSLACMAVLICGVNTSSAVANEPSIDQLIAGVRNVTSEDERISSFRVTVECRSEGEPTYIRYFAWSRPDRCRFLMTGQANDAEIPLYFYAQRQALLYDLSRREIAIVSDVRMKFGIGIQRDRVRCVDSIHTTATLYHAVIDLRSMFNACAESRELKRDAEGCWRLSGTTKSGSVDFVATFADDVDFSLMKIEAKNTGDDSSTYVIRDIVLNQENTRHWPDIPPMRLLPEGLRVQEIRNPHSLSGSADFLTRFVRTAGLFEALVNPERRDNLNVKEAGYFDDVNWEQAEEGVRTLAPPLLDLLKTAAYRRDEGQFVPVAP